MGQFNLDDYAPVDERIGMFYDEHPAGRILTAIEKLEPPLVVFKAEVFRDAEDTRPWATGYAYEKEGASPVNKTSYIENCETSAIGRALANAGYHGKRENAPRPSREEMQKVQRMEQLAGEPPKGNVPTAQRVQNGNGGTPLDTVVSVGKHKGKTWRELVRVDPKYCEWATENMDRLDHTIKDAIRDALYKVREPAQVPLSEPEPDGLPF